MGGECEGVVVEDFGIDFEVDGDVDGDLDWSTPFVPGVERECAEVGYAEEVGEMNSLAPRSVGNFLNLALCG